MRRLRFSSSLQPLRPVEASHPSQTRTTAPDGGLGVSEGPELTEGLSSEGPEFRCTFTSFGGPCNDISRSRGGGANFDLASLGWIVWCSPKPGIQISGSSSTEYRSSNPTSANSRSHSSTLVLSSGKS